MSTDRSRSFFHFEDCSWTVHIHTIDSTVIDLQDGEKFDVSKCRKYRKCTRDHCFTLGIENVKKKTISPTLGSSSSRIVKFPH